MDNIIHRNFIAVRNKLGRPNMSEKSISERGKETLKWIQREQKTNGLGMVELDKVPDQAATRFLLRKGDVFEPQQGMVQYCGGGA